MHARVRTLDNQQVVYTSGVEFVDVSPSAQAAIDHYLTRTGETTVEGAEGGAIE